MVFKKQYNPEGDYVTKDQEMIDEEGNTVVISGGTRYEILSCERTESMEYVQTGTDTQIIDGETVEVPVYEQQVTAVSLLESVKDDKPCFDRSAFTSDKTSFACCETSLSGTD